MAKKDGGKAVQLLVWDLPTRLFHWCLVTLVTISLLTGLGWTWLEDEAEIHEWSGIGVLVLLVFRLFWGFVGGRHARFADFLAGPKSIMKYAKEVLTGTLVHWRGHNPIGGLSVFAMLTLLIAQVGTGLFANDDSEYEAPLFDLIEKDTSDWLTTWHYDIATAIYYLIGIHIAAILFYRFKGEKLTGPMIHGRKPSATHAKSERGPAESGHPVRALIVLAVSVGLAYAILALGDW
ncbi:MAG TPA: cytochrome B [Rhodospirillaceae bacterium]|nr:cytochrome B [Rhodospirillaceae bacterium]HAT34693.1 cytochrome B [Rhodospirillaceae bacterium]